MRNNVVEIDSLLAKIFLDHTSSPVVIMVDDIKPSKDQSGKFEVVLQVLLQGFIENPQGFRVTLGLNDVAVVCPTSYGELFDEEN